MGSIKSIVLAGIIVGGLISAYMLHLNSNRYEITTSPTGDVYKLDKKSGELTAMPRSQFAATNNVASPSSTRTTKAIPEVLGTCTETQIVAFTDRSEEPTNSMVLANLTIVEQVKDPEPVTTNGLLASKHESAGTNDIAEIISTGEDSGTTEKKDSDAIAKEDQEIIKGLKFSDPVVSPLDSRHWTFIKGQIDVRNSSPRNTIAGKLVIEMRMLFKNEDKEWSVIRCIRDFGIPKKGNQTISISFREQNHLFEMFYADSNAEPKDTYTAVRYLGALIFESPGKDYSSIPKSWWQDNSLVINKSMSEPPPIPAR